MGNIVSDLRHGFRTLSSNPPFTAVAVLALAVGIGVNTAIFSMVNAVLLRPLPYQDPDRLVMVFERLEKVSPGPVDFSPPDFAIFAREQQIFTEMAAFVNKQYEVSGAAEPERMTGARVSAGLFSVLGVSPVLGRSFTRDEDQPGRNVVLLSDGLWRRKFAADPSILGKSIRIDRHPYTVIGIMPESFQFPLRGPIRNNTPAELWVPLAFTPEELAGWTSRYNHSVVARLRPGLTLEQARTEATTITRRLQEEFYPPDSRSSGLFVLNAAVEPLQAEVTGRMRPLLLLLQGVVALVLLIACADVANPLLTRAAARQREMAIRTALGAGRLRLVQQLLGESLPLALAGGALGLLLTHWAIRVLALAPLGIPRTTEIRIDATVLSFTLLLCCGTALLFGLIPALHASGFHSPARARQWGWSSWPERDC